MEAPERMIEDILDYFGITVDPGAVSALSLYINELEKWNRHMNLTGLRRTDDIVYDLVSDGIFLHTVLPDDCVVLDLGSGAGILAVPLALLGRARAVKSVDKSLRKTQFQRQIGRLLNLSNMEIFHSRLEEMNHISASVLVAKAFGSVADILRLGGPHLTESGSAFLVRGGGEVAPVREPHFSLEEVRPYRLPKRAKLYQLFIYKKVTRPGVLC